MKEIERPADAGREPDDQEREQPDDLELPVDAEALMRGTAPDARTAAAAGAGVVLEDRDDLKQSPLSPDGIGVEVADFVALSADENAEEVLEEIGRHTLDPDILADFEERQRLAYGSDELALKLQQDRLESPEATAGDIDAAWDWSAVGEEMPGGSVATPDQDVVDEIGRAVGLTYEDNEPLRGADKVEGRDQDRWELNPASAEQDPTLGIRFDVDDLDPESWDEPIVGPGLDLDDDDLLGDDDWPGEDDLEPYDEELDEIEEQLEKEDGFVP